MTRIGTVVGTCKHNLCKPVMAPFLAQCNHSGDGHINSLADPLGTVLAKHTEGVATPIMAPITLSNTGGSVGSPAGDPVHTIRTAVDHNALAAAHVAEFKGQDIGQPALAPLRTITAGGGQFGEVRARIAQYENDHDMKHWPKIRQLLNTHCGYSLADDEVILLIIGGIAWYIGDITLRMLTPRELCMAMGCPEDYVIDRDFRGEAYPKNKQVARIGNMVCPPMAAAMVRANLPEWCMTVDVSTLAKFHSYVSA